jgi:predicted NBD/HSP70 family sugar kinase
VGPAGERVQVVAVDFEVDRVRVALVGLGGSVTARRSRRLSRTRDPEDVMAMILDMIGSVWADPARGADIVGLGVSLPGVIRQSDGCVRFAPNLGWVDVPLAEMLQARLPDLPVWLGNDADLGLLAEHRRGAARGVGDAVFLAGDVGVGGGMIIDGRPLVGAGGYAGELGHMVVNPDGLPCRCGARGCWETEIGLPAIARALGLGQDFRSEELPAALLGDGVPAGALDRVGHYLGLGMASIVNLVNPRLFIVGGVLREVYPLVERTAMASLRERALAAPAEQVRIAVPLLGGDAALVGASELAWSDLLADPTAVLGARRLRASP